MLTFCAFVFIPAKCNNLLMDGVVCLFYVIYLFIWDLTARGPLGAGVPAAVAQRASAVRAAAFLALPAARSRPAALLLHRIITGV